MRNAEDHSASSIHWSGIVTTDASNASLSVSVEREANSGTVTVGGEKATIFIRKLTGQQMLISKGSSLTTGSNWNPDSKDSIQWNSDIFTNSSVFSHSELSNPHEITVLEDGDYYLTYNGAFSVSSGIRPVSYTHLTLPTN